MATATEIIANETEIKQAMEVLKLDNWVDDLLDEKMLDKAIEYYKEKAPD